VNTKAPQNSEELPKKRPPVLPGGLPLIGHTLSFVRDLEGLLRRAREECGDVVSIPIVGRSIILVTGPKGQEEVFRAPDSILNPKAAYKLMVPIFGKGVAYDCEDERMHEQLMMLMPALRNKRMRSYGHVIADEVDQSIANWGDSGTIDIYEYMQELTSYTSSHCLLGAEFRGEMNDEFARVYHTLERSIIPIAFLNPYLPLPTFRKRDKARKRLGEMVSEIVEQRRKSGHRGEDFLQTLMESTYKDGSTLTDHEITGMLVAAMFAGHHTSSVTATWALLEMLQHPEWMKEVKDEIARVYAGGREVDFESLRELQKTEWVIKEALRLHPPLFILFRVAQQDTSILGHFIPKGTWVALSPSVGHRIESVFKQADGFCPYRFGPPDREDQQPFAYIAFGGGRHKCLGNAFAIHQIKTIVAKLLRIYDFALTDDPIQTDFQGLVLGPKSPIRLTYKKVDDIAEGTTEPEAETEEAKQRTVRPFRLVVDEDLCQGHGVCEGDAPELFALKHGKVSILQEHPSMELREKAEMACRYCPQRALSIVDD
jgi:sterol 14-demethylase